MADAPLIGIGERALFVAKQLALNKRFRNCSTVERDKRLVTPGPVKVDGSCYQLFSGAAFTGEEHRCLASATWRIIS